MANIMNQVDVKNNAHRNGFDLSHKLAFTSQSGMLLPVFSQNVLPGDSFNVSVSSFTRTQPVNTAAYTRIKEYFDWYFVPLHLLWSRAPQCIAQTNDMQQWFKPAAPHASNSPTLSTTFPSFPTERFNIQLGYVKGASNASKFEPYFGFRAFYGAVRLLEHLGYGYRLVMGSDGEWDYMKPINTPVNLWRLCAYQKIYNDWFRVSQWEESEPWTFNLDYYDDDTSGFQRSWQNAMVGLATNKSNMLTMRFAPWHKDMFTGVLPNQQFGNASAVDLNISSITGTLNALGSGNFLYKTGTNDVRLLPGNAVFNVESETATTIDSFADLASRQRIVASNTTPQLSKFSFDLDSSNSSFSVLHLRMAEAQQKWAEITQSGRLDYKSQMQKHFGVTPADALAHRSEYLGGTSGVLDINEVVNSNLTGGADANLAGKGVGSMQGHIKFTAKEHGILMCIYHNEPLIDYGSTVFDKQVTETTPNDMPIPEFDSIGMDPLYLHQLLGNFTDETQQDTVLGYVPRYIHYKTCVDKVLGAFNGTLSSWVTPLTQQYLYELLKVGSTTSSTFKMQLGYFHVNPALLNPIFGVNADLSPNTDQFLHNVFFDIKVARNLDRNGLPY